MKRTRVFVREVATGSRQEPKVRVSEYATNQKPKAVSRSYCSGKWLEVVCQHQQIVAYYTFASGAVAIEIASSRLRRWQ